MFKKFILGLLVFTLTCSPTFAGNFIGGGGSVSYISSDFIEQDTDGNTTLGGTDADNTSNRRLLVFNPNGNADIQVEEYQSNATGPNLLFLKARGTSSSPEGVDNDAGLGVISWRSFDDVDTFRQAVRIVVNTDNPTSPTDSSGIFRIDVVPPSSTTPATRFFISSDGIMGFSDSTPGSNYDFKSPNDSIPIISAYAASGTSSTNAFELDTDGDGSADDFIIDTSGEAFIAGVAGDGTGQAICVKSDGNLGTCTDTVGVTGACTCA